MHVIGVLDVFLEQHDMTSPNTVALYLCKARFTVDGIHLFIVLLFIIFCHSVAFCQYSIYGLLLDR